MTNLKAGLLLFACALLGVVGGIVGGRLSAWVFGRGASGSAVAVVDAQTFRLVDAAGRTRAALTFDDRNSAGLVFYGEDGNSRLSLGALPRSWTDAPHVPSAIMGLFLNGENHQRISLATSWPRGGEDSSNSPALEIEEDGSGLLTVSPSGLNLVSLGFVAGLDKDGLRISNPAPHLSLSLDSDGLSIGTSSFWATLDKDGLSIPGVANLGRYAPGQYAEFDPSEKGYGRLDSESGSFVISVNAIKPYADGCMVSLEVGNLTSATYQGFTLHSKWGPRFSKGANYSQWQASLKEKDLSLTDVLRPGVWNRVDIAVSPAKTDQLGYIELSNMRTDLVSFRK